jgi:hypothetical protein
MSARNPRAIRRARPSVARACAVVLGMAGLGGAGACNQDPVHDDEVSALGGEDPNVPSGPDHRPGQPCLVCHGGSGPASAVFAVGGTAYVAQTGPDVPLSGATVSLLDANGSPAQATTNSVGNFWIPASAWTPTFPVHVEGVTFGQYSAQMVSHIGRDGSCASCHYDPAGGSAVGHIFIVPGDYPAGGLGDGGS